MLLGRKMVGQIDDGNAIVVRANHPPFQSGHSGEKLNEKAAGIGQTNMEQIVNQEVWVI